jgi:4-hydroxythreonine-4-phosphate dehydrogenase
MPSTNSDQTPGGTRQRPLLALTVGDPAGIGPEIAVRAATEPEVSSRARTLIVGDASVVDRAARLYQLDVKVNVTTDPHDVAGRADTLDVYDIGVAHADDIAVGQVSELAGRSAIASIESATRLAMEGRVDAVVTAPINKEAIWATGSEHLGHTEMLQALTGARESTTMFVVRGLKIFFTTRHTALRQALDQIDVDRVTGAIGSALTALRVFGHDRPRLAVAAINPHGGEGGNFGREEIDVLTPAVDASQAPDAEVTGPIPADSVFHQGVQGRYDGVLSHYHDQGHIAAKTLDFNGTVSVTTGLPILRTSVDHGTAFDIAGAGQASHQTMVAATLAAADFAQYLDRIRATYTP